MNVEVIRSVAARVTVPARPVIVTDVSAVTRAAEIWKVVEVDPAGTEMEAGT